MMVLRCILPLPGWRKAWPGLASLDGFMIDTAAGYIAHGCVSDRQWKDRVFLHRFAEVTYLRIDQGMGEYYLPPLLVCRSV